MVQMGGGVVLRVRGGGLRFSTISRPGMRAEPAAAGLGAIRSQKAWGRAGCKARAEEEGTEAPRGRGEDLPFNEEEAIREHLKEQTSRGTLQPRDPR